MRKNRRVVLIVAVLLLLIFPTVAVYNLSVYGRLLPTNESHCWEMFPLAGEMDLQSDSLPVNNLNAVVGIGNSEAWAVGDNYRRTGTNTQGAPEGVQQAVALHFENNRWKIVPMPQVEGKGSTLTGVASVSSDDVWAVGYYGETEATTGNLDVESNYLPARGQRWHEAHTLIVHWNGTAWNIVRSPDPEYEKSGLDFVYPLSSDDVWAAGWAVSTDISPVRPFLEHWDGKGWTLTPTPKYQGLDLEILGFAPSPGGDVWATALGQPKELSDPNERAYLYMLHWDGRTWDDVRLSSPDPNSPLRALGGLDSYQEVRKSVVSTPADSWVVGAHFGTKQTFTLTLHWNGAGWFNVGSPNSVPAPGVIPSSYLEDVSAAAPNDIWAVGRWMSSYGDYPNPEPYEKPLALHWDGASWGIELDSMPFNSHRAWLGAVNANKSAVWALGFYQKAEWTYIPMSFRRDAERCRAVAPLYELPPTPTPDVNVTELYTETPDPRLVPTYPPAPVPTEVPPVSTP